MTRARKLASLIAACAIMALPLFAHAQSITYPGVLVQQSSTLGALNAKANAFSNFGFLSCTINIQAGLVGTVTFNVASDQAGTGYTAYAFTPQGGGTAVTTTTTSGVYQATFAGPVTACQAIVTAYTSGSAVVNVAAGANPGQGPIAVTGIPTPAPVPTSTAGIPYVQPTGGPFPSLIVNFPTPAPLGQALSSASIPVVPASDWVALSAGSSTTRYAQTLADTFTTSAAISTATTTLVKAGVVGSRIFISYAAFDASGTNTTATFTFVAGTTTSTPCDTAQIPLFLSGQSILTGALSVTPAWSGGASSTSMIPAPVTFPVPVSDNVCITTAGVAVAGNAVLLSATHI